MTSQLAASSAKPPQEIIYPSADGEPLAETSVHVDAIVNIVVALRQYLQGQRTIVLANQFLYYAQGFPKLRVAPDVMVIFDVEPGDRDNYKIWEEGQVPVVIFEVTSASTQDQDEGFKKSLYESIEVHEYWQFDPRGEWIPEQLRGYRLQGDTYTLISDSRSIPLQLRLAAEGHLLSFYREDTGDKLPTPDELRLALQQAIADRQQLAVQLEQERDRAERLANRLRELGENPEDL